MENRYKLIITNNRLYKEIELNNKPEVLKIGTTIECNYRMHKESFFEPIEITLLRDNNEWSIQCSDNLYITTGDIRKLITKKLSHGDSIEIKYQKSNNKVFSIDFLIDFDSGRKLYQRAVDISKCSDFCIGGNNACDIVLKSDFIEHDMISFKKKDTSLHGQIKDSKYGVYHNGNKAVNPIEIRNGDFFSLCEFSFYYKDQVLWTEVKEGIVTKSLNYKDLPEANSYPKFKRNIRLKIVNDESEIEILDPPTLPKRQKFNIWIKLLPSLGMLIASGVMAMFGGAMIIFSAISGIMAILTTLVNIREGKKEYKRNVIDRNEKYTAYIEMKEKEIIQKREEEKSILEEIYVSQDIIKQRFQTFSSELFDRIPSDDDYLCVSLGTGDVEAKRKIKFKKQEKLEIEDDLQQEPSRLFQTYQYVKDAPIVCNLKDMNALGISGKIEYQFEFLKNIVIDLISRQYHTEMKMIFVAEEKNKDQIYWLRFLPHVYNESIKSRTIVCDDESRNYIFEYLYKELSCREQNKISTGHILIFFYDDYGFKNHPISKFIDKAKSLGASFIFFNESKNVIPLGCEYIIDINDKNTANYIKCADKRQSINFQYPHISNDEAEEIVRIVAPVYTEEISLEATLTKNISMFELLNIFTVDDLNLHKRWETSKVYSSMAAPIGVSKTGIIELDLHDKAHGPHGLVAGTTGSGKSEILQTYILAMSTLFHPYEVGFLIIDFKGGGMVNQFRNLPHLLGAITNIDGKEIDRSLKSIKAELQKRQRLFAEADVNHIDKYIKKYKKNEVVNPLPHLIIIVDEFAELKAEQPEFMKELISAARIGRSLGVHLILATQKPSGQVNEQIWSNSRFKLCLKVQSQEDSNEVLKSPLAAEIKEPGRAYLQVGNNEIFELFQSAYSGAPEKIDDSAIKEFTISQLYENSKKTPVYIQKKKKVEGENTTQLDALVSFIHNYCEESGIIQMPSICLPPLPDYITVPVDLGDSVIDNLALGVYDDPDSQYQGAAKFHLCEENLMIIGSTLTGKTNLLQTIIRMLAQKYSPKEVVFYITDFGSMYLKNFEKLHHVGGVVTISENEKLKNLFKLLMNEIQVRKNKFLEYGLSSFSAYKEAGYQDFPQIFLMIDNFSAFKEVYAESYEDQFIYLTREGLSYGITVIITNSVTAGLGYKYMSNFASRIAFKCNDMNEYITLFDRCKLEAKDVPGRMLCKLNKELYEAQSYLAFEGEKEIQRSEEVRKFVNLMNSDYVDIQAKRIPSVPDTLSFDYLDQNYPTKDNPKLYPIALDYANVDLVNIDMKKMNELCIIGRETKENLNIATSVLTSVHHYALYKPTSLYIIDSVERPLKTFSEYSYVENYTIDYSEIGVILDQLLIDLESRYDLLMNGEMERLSKFPQIIICVNNREAIDYLSTSKELLESYLNIVKKYKSLGVSFVFTDIEDVNIGYNASELLKRFKEIKKAIITSNLKDFKFCEIPSQAIRNNKEANADDCFLLDGSDITRIKIAKE